MDHHRSQHQEQAPPPNTSTGSGSHNNLSGVPRYSVGAPSNTSPPLGQQQQHPQPPLSSSATRRSGSDGGLPPAPPQSPFLLAMPPTAASSIVPLVAPSAPVNAGGLLVGSASSVVLPVHPHQPYIDAVRSRQQQQQQMQQQMQQQSLQQGPPQHHLFPASGVGEGEVDVLPAPSSSSQQQQSSQYVSSQQQQAQAPPPPRTASMREILQHEHHHQQTSQHQHHHDQHHHGYDDDDNNSYVHLTHHHNVTMTNVPADAPASMPRHPHAPYREEVQRRQHQFHLQQEQQQLRQLFVQQHHQQHQQHQQHHRHQHQLQSASNASSQTLHNGVVFFDDADRRLPLPQHHSHHHSHPTPTTTAGPVVGVGRPASATAVIPPPPASVVAAPPVTAVTATSNSTPTPLYHQQRSLSVSSPLFAAGTGTGTAASALSSVSAVSAPQHMLCFAAYRTPFSQPAEPIQRHPMSNAAAAAAASSTATGGGSGSGSAAANNHSFLRPAGLIAHPHDVFRTAMQQQQQQNQQLHRGGGGGGGCVRSGNGGIADQQDFEEKWAFIEQAIAEIHQRRACACSYQQLHSRVFSLVVQRRAADLYQRLEQHTKTRIAQQASIINRSSATTSPSTSTGDLLHTKHTATSTPSATTNKTNVAATTKGTSSVAGGGGGGVGGGVVVPPPPVGGDDDDLRFLLTFAAEYEQHKLTTERVNDIMLYLNKNYCSPNGLVGIREMGRTLFHDLVLGSPPPPPPPPAPVAAPATVPVPAVVPAVTTVRHHRRRRSRRHHPIRNAADGDDDDVVDHNNNDDAFEEVEGDAASSSASVTSSMRAEGGLMDDDDDASASGSDRSDADDDDDDRARQAAALDEAEAMLLDDTLVDTAEGEEDPHPPARRRRLPAPSSLTNRRTSTLAAAASTSSMSGLPVGMGFLTSAAGTLYFIYNSFASQRIRRLVLAAIEQERAATAATGAHTAAHVNNNNKGNHTARIDENNDDDNDDDNVTGAEGRWGVGTAESIEGDVGLTVRGPNATTTTLAPTGLVGTTNNHHLIPLGEPGSRRLSVLPAALTETPSQTPLYSVGRPTTATTGEQTAGNKRDRPPPSTLSSPEQTSPVRRGPHQHHHHHTQQHPISDTTNGTTSSSPSFASSSSSTLQRVATILHDVSAVAFTKVVTEPYAVAAATYFAQRAEAVLSTILSQQQQQQPSQQQQSSLYSGSASGGGLAHIPPAVRSDNPTVTFVRMYLHDSWEEQRRVVPYAHGALVPIAIGIIRGAFIKHLSERALPALSTVVVTTASVSKTSSPALNANTATQMTAAASSSSYLGSSTELLQWYTTLTAAATTTTTTSTNTKKMPFEDLRVVVDVFARANATGPLIERMQAALYVLGGRIMFGADVKGGATQPAQATTTTAGNSAGGGSGGDFTALSAIELGPRAGGGHNTNNAAGDIYAAFLASLPRAAPRTAASGALVDRLLTFVETTHTMIDTVFTSRLSHRSFERDTLLTTIRRVVNAHGRLGEYLAHRMDTLLRSSAASVSTVTALADRVLALYELMEDRDLFDHAYQHCLAQRLLARYGFSTATIGGSGGSGGGGNNEDGGNNSSVDFLVLEAAFLKQFKLATAAGFGAKLEAMIKDCQLSATIAADFAATYLQLDAAAATAAAATANHPSATLPSYKNTNNSTSTSNSSSAGSFVSMDDPRVAAIVSDWSDARTGLLRPDRLVGGTTHTTTHHHLPQPLTVWSPALFDFSAASGSSSGTGAVPCVPSGGVLPHALHVSVLTQGHWPRTSIDGGNAGPAIGGESGGSGHGSGGGGALSTGCLLPAPTVAAALLFHQFYLSRHRHRLLTFLPNSGTMELRMRLPVVVTGSTSTGNSNTCNTSTTTTTTTTTRNVTVVAATPVAVVLLQFQQDQVLTVEELGAVTGLGAAEAGRAVAALLRPTPHHAPLLRVAAAVPNVSSAPTPSTNTNTGSSSSSSAWNVALGPTTRVTYNPTFKTQSRLIRIASVAVRGGDERGASGSSSASGGASATASRVQRDRSVEIQAVTVKVMKSRQRRDHADLVADVQSALQRVFMPARDDIKRVVEGLIDRQFLARDPENPSTYVYIA